MGVTGMMVSVRAWRELWELWNSTHAMDPWKSEKQSSASASLSSGVHGMCVT